MVEDGRSWYLHQGDAAFNTISPLAIFYLSNMVWTAIIAAELKKLLEIGMKLINEMEI